MGRRGPAPKPTALKLASGNPGKRPINTSEPVPPAGEPEMPPWFDQDEQRIWREIVPRLCRVGLARIIDGPALQRYCTHAVMWARDRAWVAQYGSTYPVREAGRRGKEGRIIGWKEFPQSAALRRTNQQLLQMEREFGLTPAARTRISVEADKSSKGDVNELKRRFFANLGQAPAPGA